MDMNREKVETLGRLYHQFYDDVIEHNINELEWNEFTENMSKWFTILEYPNKDFDMDEHGSRWIEPRGNLKQDEDWEHYTKTLSYELDDILIQWLSRNRDRGWNEFIDFLNVRKNEFITELKDYYRCFRIEDEVGEDEEHTEKISDSHDTLPDDIEEEDGLILDDDDEMEGMTVDENIDEEEEKKDDGVSIEEIINQLHQEMEEEQRILFGGEPQ
jgi:hypothetical protein